MDILKGLVNGGLGFDVAPLSEFNRIYLPDCDIQPLLSHHNPSCHHCLLSFLLPSFFTLVTAVGYFYPFSGIRVTFEHIKL